jgi:hypothetical protein
MQLRRWASGLFIVCYLLAMAWGIGAHALKAGLACNTLSYYFVWDMFCGWSAYDNRTHIVAEDVDGNYYSVREPWGAFLPFGNVERVNYDVSNNLTPRHIRHVLEHSSHPPIDRVYVVQEIWPKQFNVPDHLWSYQFHEPKDMVSTYSLRAICNAVGTPLETYPDWFNAQTLKAIADNPRLQQASQQAKPYYNTFFNPSRMESQDAAFRGTGDSDLNTN